MKIGFAVEGWVDAGFVHGMQRRLCPAAELVEGHSRGSTLLSLRREYAKIFRELQSKNVDLIVILTDANNDDWRKRRNDETAKLPSDFRGLTVLGIPDRNIECWLCADRAWIALQLDRQESDFDSVDPSGTFKKAVGHANADKVAELVVDAPRPTWYTANESFKAFYDDLRGHRTRLGCSLENLADAR